MKRILALGLCCGLIACGSKEPPSIEAAKLAISTRMKDPNSIQFRDVRVVALNTPAGDTEVVCGEFNAKNGFGGYSGYEKFAFNPSGNDLLMRSAFPKPGWPIVDRGIEAYCNGRLPDASDLQI